jgi:hypothetical protein
MKTLHTILIKFISGTIPKTGTIPGYGRGDICPVMTH